MTMALNEAVWVVIGPAVYAVGGVLFALYVVLSILLVILGGTFNPRGAVFGRSMPFSRRLFSSGDPES